VSNDWLLRNGASAARRVLIDPASGSNSSFTDLARYWQQSLIDDGCMGDFSSSSSSFVDNILRYVKKVQMLVIMALSESS
jgi:hypothetical protein